MVNNVQPLNYSKDAYQRVLVGLRWDPQQLPFYIRWFVPKSHHNFDLDLTCYIYNDKGDFSGIVSGEELVHQDNSGAVYHSGDEKTGEFGHDDEEISVELLNLPEDIAHIVFVVTCKSAHHFDRVSNPAIRLADAKTNENQLKLPLDEDGKDKDAYIFARIYKDGETWMVEPVNEFLDKDKIDNWPVFLQSKWSLA